jgi:hypothetical protein
MIPKGTIAVGDRKFTVVEIPDGAPCICEGCAADGDDDLCTSMPECVGVTSCGDDEDFGVIYKEVK